MALELDIDNKSFYDFPGIKPTNNDVPSGGPVQGIPGRVEKPGSDFTAMKKPIPGNTKITKTPENDPRSWNMGGNGNWWSVYKEDDSSGEVIND